MISAISLRCIWWFGAEVWVWNSRDARAWDTLDRMWAHSVGSSPATALITFQFNKDLSQGQFSKDMDQRCDGHSWSMISPPQLWDSSTRYCRRFPGEFSLVWALRKSVRISLNDAYSISETLQFWFCFFPGESSRRTLSMPRSPLNDAKIAAIVTSAVPFSYGKLIYWEKLQGVHSMRAPIACQGNLLQLTCSPS